MSPNIRWFELHVTAPLERLYSRLDEHAAQLDPEHKTDVSATKRKSRARLRKAA